MPQAVPYSPLPYVRGNSIGELLRLKGQRAAEAEQQRGAITSQMFARLGEQIANSVNSYAQQQREAPIRKQEALARTQEAEARTIGLDNARAEQGAMRKAAEDKSVLGSAQGSGLEPEAVKAQLQQLGRGDLIPIYEQTHANLETARVGLQEKKTALKALENDYFGALASGVKKANYDPVAVDWALSQAEADGHDVGPIRQHLQQNPQALPQMIDTLIEQSPTQRKLAGEEADRALKTQQENRAIRTAEQVAADRVADNARQTATATETARHDRAMENRPVAGATTPLANLGPQHEPIIQALLDYRQPLPTGVALTRGDWPALLEAAHTLDPTFDVSQYQVRQQLKRSFTSGKDADNIRSLNTAVGHLGSLATAMDAMGNGNWESVNSAKNALATRLPVTSGLVERQGKQTKVRLDFNAVKGELAGIFKASGATDQEIKSWETTLPKDPAAATPEEKKAFLAGTVELMGSRMGANRQKYETGMGGKSFPSAMLSPTARKILQGVGIDPNTVDPVGSAAAQSGQIIVTAPDGSKHDFATQAEADRFKQLIAGQKK